MQGLSKEAEYGYRNLYSDQAKGLDGSGSNPGRGQIKFTLFQNVQTGAGVHPASHSMCTGVLSPGVKKPNRQIDVSSPNSTEDKNEWS